MNFQELADRFYAPVCVLSVEKKPDGGHGDVCIVAGNKKYLEPILDPVPFAEMGMTMPHNEFIPGTPYERYLPKDVGFEELCYRGAVKKETVHTCVHMNFMDVWFDIYVLPLDFEDGGLCYCVYSAIPCSADEVGINSSNAGNSSEDVLRTCFKLYESDDFRQSMDETVKQLRLLCRAEVCTLFVMDDTKEDFSVIATDNDPNTSIRLVTRQPNFKAAAAAGCRLLVDKDCIIIEGSEDMEFFRDINSLWYELLIKSNADSVMLFPLRHNGEILGFIWAANYDTFDTIRIKDALELTAFFISAKISNYRMMEQLRKISYSDVLTGLPNRLACTGRMAELVRRGERFTSVSIDLNHFKSINESLGFEAGNRVLVGIAKRWKALAEGRSAVTEDYIARISGDEFMLLISGYASEEQVRGTISEYESVLEKLLTVDNCDLHITASFGYAEYPADADNADLLMTCAGAAMRDIKRANSSEHIARFRPEFLETKRTLELEEKIRAALENDTIFFNLQPQYDIEHRLRGFEALARMRDENGAPVSPGEFIPVSEKVGLIDKVDGAVFRKAMMFFGELLRESGRRLILSINASVRHLMKNDFLDEIRGLLNDSGVPAECLEIEITESIMIDSAEKALECINALKAMGVKLAIDDFGTGYSALSYLNSFPADLLKIDKSFIDKIHLSEKSGQYVAAIVSMGHIMGFEVIAEGVEMPEQLEALRGNGCDFIQGFIWDRPLMPEDARALAISSDKK